MFPSDLGTDFCTGHCSAHIYLIWNGTGLLYLYLLLHRRKKHLDLFFRLFLV